jgi:hypothetical protein
LDVVVNIPLNITKSPNTFIINFETVIPEVTVKVYESLYNLVVEPSPINISEAAPSFLTNLPAVNYAQLVDAPA